MDSWIERGTTISPHYDSLLAKLMVFASDREAATKKMSASLAETQVHNNTLCAFLIVLICVSVCLPCLSLMHLTGKLTTKNVSAALSESTSIHIRYLPALVDCTELIPGT